MLTVKCVHVCVSAAAEELLQVAKQRLERFAYVGTTSQLQESVEELVAALGASFSQTAHPWTKVRAQRGQCIEEGGG